MKAKQYEVIGTRKVHDHLPGERFWATYEPELEKILLGVHIAIVLPQADATRARGRRQAELVPPRKEQRRRIDAAQRELRRPPVEQETDVDRDDPSENDKQKEQ